MSKAIVNHSNDGSTKRSAFGEGWWLDGLDQLYSSSTGVLWVQGNGDVNWFNWNGTTYDKSAGDFSFSTLTKPTGSTFKITDKWGNERNFDLESDNITGTLVSIKNLNNTANSYSFAYDSSNRLTTITDEFSRNYTLSYTSGLFNKIIHGNNLSTWELFPTLGEGLKTGTGNTAYVVTDNISTSGANAAKYIDERGYDFKFKTDQFGNVVSYFPKSARYAGSELAGPHENNKPRSTRL